MITKMTPENAGCIISGSVGQYGVSSMVQLAESWGYDDSKVIQAAYDHMAEKATEDQLSLLFDFAANDVETWLNENVAPEGYQFGWNDGEFFLQEDFWWDDDIYDEEDYEPESNGIDDFEFYYYDALNPYDIEYDV